MKGLLFEAQLTITKVKQEIDWATPEQLMVITKRINEAECQVRAVRMLVEARLLSSEATNLETAIEDSKKKKKGKRQKNDIWVFSYGKKTKPKAIRAGKKGKRK